MSPKGLLTRQTIWRRSVVMCALASLCLLEISLISAVLIVASLLVLIDFGLQLTAKAGFGDVGFGIAFVVGTGIFVVVGQLLIISGVPAYFAHGLVILTMGGLTTLSRTFSVDSIGNQQSFVWEQTLTALSVSMLVAASRHAWIIPFAIGLLFAERLTHSKKHSPHLNWIIVPFLVVGWLISWVVRPDRWWYFYQGNDSQFFESIGWSIAHWGVFEHPGFTGGSIAGYHWLIYGINGSLSHVAQLAPWEAAMKLGPPMLTFLFVSVIVESSRLGSRFFGARGMLVIFVVSMFMPGARVDSFAFSILVAMTFFHVAELCNPRQSSILQCLVLALMSFALVFAKVSSALVVAALLVVLTAIRVIRREIVAFRPIITLVATLGFTYFLVFRAQDSGETLTEFSPSMASSLNELRNLLEYPGYVGQIVVWLLAIIIFWKPQRISGSRTLALAVVVPVGVGFQILQASGTSSYFGLPGLYLTTFLCTGPILNAVAQKTEFKSPKTTVKLICLAMIGLPLGLAYTKTFDRLEPTVEPSVPLVRFLLDVSRGSGYLAIACVPLIVASRFRWRSREAMGLAVLLFLASMSFGIGMDNYRRTSLLGPDQYTNWGGNSAPFPNQNLLEISRKIRVTTPQDTVLASNNFCCFGSSWWEEIAGDPESHTRLSGETKWGGANYLLPAETRRRFLVQGLRFQTGYKPASAEQIRRVWLSLDFANKPTRQVTAELKTYGVSGFVVNLSLTDNRDWSEFAIEKFRSGDFVYLELI